MERPKPMQDNANLSYVQEVLRAYIREMDQEGLLDNPPHEDVIPPPPVASQSSQSRQLEPAQPALPESDPPFFEPQPVLREDSGMKEMLAREDNMKFPASMKHERRKPESRVDDTAQNRQEMTQVSKALIPDMKDPYYVNTDGTSDEEDDSDSSIERPNSPTSGEVIRTAELIALSQALTLLSPGAPGGLSAGSFVDDYTPPVAHRPRKLEYGSSPAHPGAIPIPLPIPQQNSNLSTSPLPNAPYNDRLGTSPRPAATYLAPDDKGNEIKPDALWTKIDRRLVSPEVLAQHGRRYEAYVLDATSHITTS